jgi:transmembrane sensor
VGAIAAAVALLTGAGVVTLAVVDREEPLPATAILELPPIAMPSETPRGSVMALADGSRALLDDGSRVDTEIQTEGLVRLVQREGRVRYEIAPDPDRVFVVHAGIYEVRVAGTVFVVDVAVDRLRVEVEKGAVEVMQGDRSIALVAGERVELPVEPPAAEAAEPAEPPTSDTRPSRGTSVRRLLERADAARRDGKLRKAANALRALVRTHPRDARAPSAWFMLGRVERRLGHHAAAARAFRSAHKTRPTGALAEDARAEEAWSWKDAGFGDRARDTARAYLDRYPNGTHAARVRPLAH